MPCRDVVAIDGGDVLLGSERHYPEEGPVHLVRVRPFEIDRYAVTNSDFAAFVEQTGYRTVVERPPSDAGGGPPQEPGSLVFRATSGPVDLRDWRQWWAFVPGASWRHPEGPRSDLTGRGDHPVVHVAHEDAAAYAGWAGMRLPTEQEWEVAARGGLRQAEYAWGEQSNEGGAHANTWQGRFPYRNDGARGWVGTAPVGSFPPNGFGLHEMTGNTWEWTASAWTARHDAPGCGCSPGGAGPSSWVTKGGSHLCAPEYCLRYRPAARTPQAGDSATTHLGFRCAR